MKGKILFLSTIFVLLFINWANADENIDAARAATRRSVSTTVASSRQPNQNSQPTQQNNIDNSISRSTNTSIGQTAQYVRERDTSARSSGVISRESSTIQSTRETPSISARTATNIQPRSTVSLQSATQSQSRSSAVVRNVNSIPRSYTSTAPKNSDKNTTISRSATTISRNIIDTPNTSRGSETNQDIVSRRATTTNNPGIISREAITAEEIMNRDYTKCREVYYSCMDEFCANKDSQLKRCACSSRINEFESLKKQLTEVEDKLLDFNQRLLTVNMDKEDAEALFEATEGELAFQKEDTSDSKKLLDEIAQKLNTTFEDSNLNQNLSPISLSLNVDAAFDSVDSLMGASTTTKTGTELYSAALPICREMALEVCSQDELDIVESGYQMAIEQDCNTVAKTYETQQEQAREKIFEGSALLDMSRLDIYQKRNSDDILTCKKKMLNMLTDSSVCGTNLEKCLDITGKYIDPSTGEAILTMDLVDLGNLITRPDSTQTWTSTPGNDKFVSYLNSKKKFLEPAMENCQDIADYVWDEFIEDALSQIKLAQESKLEEVRQSCTILTTQCLTDTAESIEDFDSRALSIFGVEADKTVREMCSDIQDACTALLNTTSGGDIWNEGMTEIATDKTYDTIIKTCREIGRACIIQSCKSISGNFGLCENIQTSVNRKSIINRKACWDEVVKCVASAGTESIENITKELNKDGLLDDNSGAFYENLYGPEVTLTNKELYTEIPNSCIITPTGETANNCVFDICEKECSLEEGTDNYKDITSIDCKICRLAEKVWGNCEAHPSTNLSTATYHNKIKIPTSESEETLLSWFAKNTNTQDEIDSCRDTSCGPGFIAYWDQTKQTTVCVSSSSVSDDNQICPNETYWRVNIGNYSNCCKTSSEEAGSRDTFGNCCLSPSTLNNIKGLDWNKETPYWNPETTSSTIGSTGAPQSVEGVQSNLSKAQGLCLPNTAKFVVATTLSGTYYETGPGYVFCLGNISAKDITDTFPEGRTLSCDGTYVIINKQTGKYFIPNYSETSQYTPGLQSFYKERGQGIQCTQTYKSKWQWLSDDANQCSEQEPKNWIIDYQTQGD